MLLLVAFGAVCIVLDGCEAVGPGWRGRGQKKKENENTRFADSSRNEDRKHGKT